MKKVPNAKPSIAKASTSCGKASTSVFSSSGKSARSASNVLKGKSIIG